MDPEFVRQQLQLNRDGGEGHIEPPGQRSAQDKVSQEQADEVARNLERAMESKASDDEAPPAVGDGLDD